MLSLDLRSDAAHLQRCLPLCRQCFSSAPASALPSAYWAHTSSTGAPSGESQPRKKQMTHKISMSPTAPDRASTLQSLGRQRCHLTAGGGAGKRASWRLPGQLDRCARA